MSSKSFVSVVQHLCLAVLLMSINTACSKQSSVHRIEELESGATAKFQAGDYSEAINLYDEIIDLNATNASYFNERAFAKYNNRDYQGAIEDFGKAISLDPTNAAYYINRVAPKSVLEDYTGAIADCNKGIELNPNLALAYNNRGYVRLILGDYVKAIADLKKAIELDSTVVQPYVLLGELDRILKKNDEAATQFQTAVKIDPKWSSAYKGLGLLQNDKLQLRSALTNFQKSLALDPAQMDIENRVCLIRMQLGDQTNVISEILGYINSPSYKKSRAGIRAIGAIPPTVLEIQPFLADAVSEQELITNASSPHWGSSINREQLCDAYYYAGMKHIMAGDKAGGALLLQKCLDTGRPTYGDEGFDEYGSAEAELRAFRN
jgi:tetratricopeptide (TPR) repeat protein